MNRSRYILQRIGAALAGIFAAILRLGRCQTSADGVAPLISSGTHFMAAKITTFDDYLAALSDANRAALEKLRKVIKAAAPKAEEGISYGLAAFRLNGKPLVALGATEKHCAFYLMSNSTVKDHAEELENYDTSTGTIRFPANKLLPVALVKKLVKARIAENAKLSGKAKKHETAAK